MSQRQIKAGYFVLEGLNSFATVHYVYYFYFFTKKAFGFGTEANLATAALLGALVAGGSFWGGKFAQKQGYHKALKLGFVVMMVSLGVGSQLSSAAGQMCVMSVMVLGMCLTWPTLEALISEGEPPGQLEKMLGIYNVVWAGAGALAYFMGGAILERFGLRSIFYVPVAVQCVQLGFTLWLEARQRKTERSVNSRVPELETEQRFVVNSGGAQAGKTPQSGLFGLRAILAGRDRRPEAAEQSTFVRMAWLANPFAYIAINTLVAIIPSIAAKLGLSTALAGFTCSAWCFARVAAFFVLWFWTGWHYRFRWLLLAYLALIGGFMAIVFARSILGLILAQGIFGAALGLIYYSSLYYSMDVSEAKGEHGGIHESAIGVGNFAGPAIGAASLYLFPQHSNSAIIAVSGLLVAGLAGLVGIWKMGRRGYDE